MPFVLPSDTVTVGVGASTQQFGGFGSDWQNLCQAYAQMFEVFWGIVHDTGSADQPATFTAGWSGLLDPTIAVNSWPQFLPYAGMFVGSQITPGTPASMAQTLVVSNPTAKRGQGFAGVYDSTNGAQGGAIVLAAQKWLTGAQRVTLQERWTGTATDAYWFVLTVDPGQVVNVAKLQAEVSAVKPAGINWVLVQSAALTWSLASGTWSTYGNPWNTY